MSYESPRKEGDPNPTKEEINSYLDKVEKDLVLSPSHKSNSPETMGRGDATAEYARYRRALEKALVFLPSVDPDLNVSIETVQVTRNSGADNYQTLALRFFCPSKPHIHWTMEIGNEASYIEADLENVVRRIYGQKSIEV